MRYFLIAGEASGDLHGAGLIGSILKKDPDAEIYCWGGQSMSKAGGKLLRDYADMAIMGLGQVIKKLPAILSNLRNCKKDIQTYQPDIIVFIDFSGFNLRIAQWAKKLQYKTAYFISPQIWATRTYRIKNIKKNIDRMFVILPFEKEFYAKHNMDVFYFGHPLYDKIKQFKPDPDFIKRSELSDKPIVALLPGSRKQEIRSVLKTMLQITSNFEDHQFIIAKAPNIARAFYIPFIEYSKGKLILVEDTYNLLYHSKAALVTSGTATLETALFNVPQTVCYKTSLFFYVLVKALIKVEFISIVNLIAGKKIVEELIQKDFNPNKLATSLRNNLKESTRAQLQQEYNLLCQKLEGNNICDQIAEELIKMNEVLIQ